MSEIAIRTYEARDADGVAQVFFDAVHIGTRDVYDAAQRRVWGQDTPDPAAWQARLAPHQSFVAVRDGEVVGFMTLEASGRIAYAFVAPDVAGQGVGRRLYGAVLEAAGALGLRILRTEASLKARPFFERLGWRTIAEQVVSRDGVSLTNVRMEMEV